MFRIFFFPVSSLSHYSHHRHHCRRRRRQRRWLLLFFIPFFPTIKQLLKRIFCIHKNRRIGSVKFFLHLVVSTPQHFMDKKWFFFLSLKLKKFLCFNHNFFYLAYVQLSSCWWFCGIFKTFTSFARCLMMGKVFK